MARYDSREFIGWKKEVDRVIRNKTGFSVHDLPDAKFRDHFEDGTDPSKMANIVIQKAGLDLD